MNSLNPNWLLPEGIEEVLPPYAWRLELVRREMLDLFRSWGYELVMPPLVEYLESLLNGTGTDLDIKTYKVTDQLNGRTMGIRADMTPQVARIDASVLDSEGPVRLCYLGTVLHTRGDNFAGSRSPLQIGAELYGSSEVGSDLEIVRLMVAMLHKLGIGPLVLGIGHAGVYRGVMDHVDLPDEVEAGFFQALQKKSAVEMAHCLSGVELDGERQNMLMALLDLNGDGAIETARAAFGTVSDGIREALDEVEELLRGVRGYLPELSVHIDLAEMCAYRYESGLIYSAFLPGAGNELARGGRYDHIGEVYGRPRPATGFSADLKTLLKYSPNNAAAHERRIFAPDSQEEGLKDVVDDLRKSGCQVIEQLGTESGAADCGCNEVLVFSAAGWKVEPFSS